MEIMTLMCVRDTFNLEPASTIEVRALSVILHAIGTATEGIVMLLPFVFVMIMMLMHTAT
jgi:hypothetical protein